MAWLWDLFTNHESVATAVLILALVAATGMALGALRIRGVGLGVAGVLFSGLVFGHFGLTIDGHVLHFAREFGLILFVYAVGLQVGPGFLEALKAHGLRLNLCAAGIVVSGAVLTVVLARTCGIAMPIAVGMFSGGTTNTPSLAAAGQAMKERPPSVEQAYAALAQVSPELQTQFPPPAEMDGQQKAKVVEEAGKMPGLGYAVAYPFGVIGIIVAMLAMRALFRIDIKGEDEQALRDEGARVRQLHTANLRVTNRSLAGMRLGDIRLLDQLRVVISRIQHDGALLVATPDSRLAEGDVLLAVGPEDQLEQLRVLIGERADVDLRSLPTDIAARRLAVTNKKVVGEPVGHIEQAVVGVQVTRVRRGEVELSPGADVRLQYGDELVVVGVPGELDKAAVLLGNAPKQLAHPEIPTVFVGIALGVLLGSVPIAFPGMPAPVKLGLAGGPLLVAIMMSRLGKIGPLVSHVPSSANMMIKELGIVLFLACVGLKSGDRFVATLVQGQGLLWMAVAALITVVPLLLVAGIARLGWGMRFPAMAGLLSGSMTDPPALAFANAITRSQGAAVAYATVYPLTMILRVVSAQVMVLLFVS